MDRKIFGAKLEFVREDDYVEYFIFPNIEEPTSKQEIIHEQTEVIKQQLLQYKEKCLKFVGDVIDSTQYIWHKDTFQLIARVSTKEEHLLYDDYDYEKEATRQASSSKAYLKSSGTMKKVPPVLLPPHLYGVTHYGDNIADEWFIVYCLMKFSALNKDCIIRIIDTDGEFLLIELADLLPKWANPDTCEQRVYIANGRLHLVQNSPSNILQLMPVAKAIAKIRANSELYQITTEMQSIIEQRFVDFRNIENPVYLHHQIVRIPINVALLLKIRPDLISAAVRAFCDRDNIDAKYCRAMRYFPPENRVRVNVRFTRCLYAMLSHNKYLPDRKTGWNFDAIANTEEYKEDLLGIKLACGFEILVSRAKGMKSENNLNNIDNSNSWQLFYKNLHKKGYFKDYLEHSQEHTRLLKQAKEYFVNNESIFCTYPKMGQEILDLLQNLNDSSKEQLLRDEENNLKSSDSDDWLNISAEELDAMLFKRYGPNNVYKCKKNINAEKFTGNIADFLDKQSTFEGIEMKTDDDASSDTSNFSDEMVIGNTARSTANKHNRIRNKVKKSRSMRRAFKQNLLNDDEDEESNNIKSRHHQGSPKTHIAIDPQLRNLFNIFIPEYKWNSSNSDMSDYADEDDIEGNFSNMTTSDQQYDEDFKAYMDQMDRELANTSIGKSFSRTRKAKSKKSNNNETDDQDFNDIEDFEPVDINVNTLRNMMDSYKSQLGTFGPVNSLLSAMGAGMSAEIPDDDDQIPESLV